MKKWLGLWLAVCLLAAMLPVGALAEEEVWTLPLSIILGVDSSQPILDVDMSNPIGDFPPNLTMYQGLDADTWCSEEDLRALLAVVVAIDFYRYWRGAPAIDFDAPLCMVKNGSTVQVFYKMPEDGDYYYAIFYLEIDCEQGLACAHYLATNLATMQDYARTLEGDCYDINAEMFNATWDSVAAQLSGK